MVAPCIIAAIPFLLQLRKAYKLYKLIRLLKSNKDGDGVGANCPCCRERLRRWPGESEELFEGRLRNARYVNRFLPVVKKMLDKKKSGWKRVFCCGGGGGGGKKGKGKGEKGGLAHDEKNARVINDKAPSGHARPATAGRSATAPVPSAGGRVGAGTAAARSATLPPSRPIPPSRPQAHGSVTTSISAGDVKTRGAGAEKRRQR
jgi:hypothetical protein